MSSLRGPSTVLRTPLDTTRKGHSPRYRHEFEHRGSGIIAIYSYGPAGEHDQLVREAKRLMRDRFGVDGAVTSGGISGWPQDEHYQAADYNQRSVETQTIFCIDVVAGPNRKPVKQCAPASADWHVAYIADWGQDYLGDGEVNLYFTGPLEDEETWRETVDRMVSEAMADEPGAAERAIILELRVRAVPQGRYWFLADGDPIVSIDRFSVTV